MLRDKYSIGLSPKDGGWDKVPDLLNAGIITIDEIPKEPLYYAVDRTYFKSDIVMFNN